MAADGPDSLKRRESELPPEIESTVLTEVVGESRRQPAVRRWGFVLTLYLLGIFMGAIDTGIVTPARTIIQHDLNVSDSLGIWRITIYTLSYAASIPVMGKMADRIGRKPVYLVSIVLFGLGSLACGLSQDTGSFAMLIGARAIQAIGGGGILPIATAEIGTEVPREGRKFGLGLVLSSQRPGELSPTVLSQCNTFLLHRLSNHTDQDLVHRLVPDNMRGLLRDLPSLPSRNAILLGWASELPVNVEMRKLPREQQPRSDDPDYWHVWAGHNDEGDSVTRAVDWATIARDWQQMEQEP